MTHSCADALSEPVCVHLWPNGAPGAIGDEEADKPTLAAYLPDQKIATGASVVVCPGGGYCNVCVGHEGQDVAEWFRERGVAAFVLRYRIAPRYHHPAPLSDAQRAIRTIRANAAKWGVDPNRIGVMGFSAGGHLASTAGTMFDEGDPAADDLIDRASSRPDFMILIYAVITTQPPYAHTGSINNLLGQAPDAQLLEQMSSDRRITPQTPPTFLMHTNADSCVLSENSILFYLALRNAGVPAEMHIYENGPHGVGLAPTDPVLGTWPKHLQMWMAGRGLM